MSSLRVLYSSHLHVRNVFNPECRRFYAVGLSLGKKKKVGKLGPVLEKKVLPVETDPKKLVKFVCGSNILKEGGQDIELKDDSEYPEWLWSVNLDRPKKLEEMDPESAEYWHKVRKMARVKHNLMSKIKNF